jgi:hypothetical protein
MRDLATFVRMPETPVYEDDLVPRGEHKIRSAWKVLLVESVMVAHFVD